MPSASSLRLVVLSLLGLTSSALFDEPLPSCSGDEAGQAYLQVHVISTDRLMGCSDLIGKPDPYAAVTVRSGVSGETKTTITRDGTYTPQWNETLDFGCVPLDSPITVTVEDADILFGDERCLGPLKLVGSGGWPESGVEQTKCKFEQSERGCVTFKLLYTKPKDEEAEATADARGAVPPPPSDGGEDITTTSSSMSQAQQQGHVNQELVDPNSTQPDAAAARNQSPATEHIDSSATRSESKSDKSARKTGGAIAVMSVLGIVACALLLTVGAVIAIHKRRKRSRNMRQQLGDGDGGADVGPASTEHEPRDLAVQKEVPLTIL